MNIQDLVLFFMNDEDLSFLDLPVEGTIRMILKRKVLLKSVC